MRADRRVQPLAHLARAFLTLLVAFALIPLAWSQTVSERLRAKGMPSGAQLQEWHRGPVSYLLSGEEARAYRALTTDDERFAFIGRFWLQRDSLPRTIRNEYREIFWERVVNSNDLFTRSTAPGWKTDRGKYYIMLGPPDEIEAENMPNQRGAVISLPGDGEDGPKKYGADPVAEGFYGLERWTYHDPPGDHLSPNLVLAFRLLNTGDYELSMNRRDSALFADTLSELITRPGGPTLTASTAASSDLFPFERLFFVLDLGRAGEAGQFMDIEELMVDAVTSEEFFGSVPFVVGEHFYKAEKGETLVALTLGIPRSELSRRASSAEPDLFIAGRIESLDGSYVERLSGPGTVPPAPDNAGRKTLIYQAARLLAPGTYTATMGLLSRSQDVIGSSAHRIIVPAFDDGLSLSSLTLTRSFRPLETGSPGTVAPFRLGAVQIVPRLQPVYSPEEEFALYYQVYGAQVDPVSGTPRLDITYRFTALDRGKFRPLGKSIQQREAVGAVQAWSFALTGWPEGTYRLDVTVEDRVGGTSVRGQVPFSVKEWHGSS